MDLVKIGDNLIEQTKTFDSFVVGVELRVELAKVRYSGEHDADALSPFVIQIGGVALAFAQKVIRDVDGQYVLQQLSIVRLQLFRVDSLLRRLQSPHSVVT